MGDLDARRKLEVRDLSGSANLRAVEDTYAREDNNNPAILYCHKCYVNGKARLARFVLRGESVCEEHQ